MPNTIIGNASDEANLLLQCAQDEGEALARKPQGGWVTMMNEHTFDTVAIGPINGVVTNNSAIITGLSSTTGLEANTFYVTGTGCVMNSLIQSVDSSSQITMNQPASLSGSSPQTVALTFAKADYPLPDDFQRPIDNTMWDRERYWNMRGPLSAQQWQFYKSSVYGQVAVQRRFRFRNIGGVNKFCVDPPPTDNGSTLVYEYVSNGWCMNASTKVRQTQWLLDTDLGVLDEYLIRLGVKWRALDRLGVDYSSALTEYLNEVDKAVAQDGGSATLDLTPPRFPPYVGSWSIQDGNFPGPMI